MAFWIAAALLAALVTYIVTRPLTRDAETIANRTAADLAVYKDQLAEIDRDVDRGALTAEEAQSAKAEVSRRLLRAAEGDQRAVAEASATYFSPKILYGAISVALPVLSLGLYLLYGAPGMPGQPLNARLNAPVQNAEVADLIAKVEQQLRAHPDDGKGWDVIAPVYYSQSRFAEAATAFSNANRILGETAARLQRFADARIRAENGVVPADARKALTRALELEPARKEPVIWLALAKEQDGDRAGAIADYKSLIADVTLASAWKKPLEDRLAMLEGRAPADTPDQRPAPAPPQVGEGDGPAGPGAAAVGAMAPEEREQFVNQMVEKLAERLKTETTDLEGWLKLVRAYKVLGRDGDATAALATARKSLSADQKAISALDGLAKELGLGS